MKQKRRRSLRSLAAVFGLIVLGFLPGALEALEEAPYDPAILPPETVAPPLPRLEPAPLANSGALELKFAIPLPPGRKGMAPDLVLTYHSGAGNGMLGVGWQLALGSIRRSIRNGLDFRGLRFEHDAGELVPRPDWGAGFYGAKREAEFRKHHFLSDRRGWEVTDREGRRWFFGSSAESRLENDHGVFEWLLDRVEDANGNWYRVRYSKDQGQPYPLEILYTGHDRLAPAYRVQFGYGNRPDPLESYESRGRVVMAKRLESLRVTANGQPARLFQLIYETGRSGRSRLKEIRRDPLPPVRFVYQEGGDGSFRPAAKTTTAGANAAGFVFFGAADGDGFPDLFKFESRGFSPEVHVYLADGAGGFRSKTTTRLEGDANTAGFIHVADFDGDGLSDILKVLERGTQGTVFFHRGVGNGSFARGVRTDLGEANDPGRILVGDVFGQDGRLEIVRLETRWGLISVHRLLETGRFDGGVRTNLAAVLDTGHVFLMDANGDRREDLVRTGTSSLVFVHLAQADGTFGPAVVTDLKNGPNDPSSLLVGDFNGDGLPDLLKVHRLSCRVSVHYSRGTGDFAPGIETDLKGAVIDAGRIRVADVNGDGRADIVLDTFNSNAVSCHLATHGGSFLPAVRSLLPGGSPLKGFLAPVNADGNGGADLTLRDFYGGFTTLLSAPEDPDLLVGLANGFGGTSRFRYGTSAEAEHPYLPFPRTTIAAIETSDGNGLSFAQEYDYAGGWYDREQGEFRGFSRMEEIRPDGSLLETEYHQDEYRAGKEIRRVKRDPRKALLARTAMAWAAEPLAGEARFVRLVAKTEERFFNPTVVSRWELEHSTLHGGLTRLRRSGSEAEETTTAYTHRNLGFWNWRIEEEMLCGADGTAVRRTRYGYDGRGNLTTEERLNETGPAIRVIRHYDSFGNPVETVDGRGQTTRYEYDPATVTFPVRIVQPRTGSADHEWKIPRLDYRIGKASVLEDENGNRTLFEYDAAGRLLRADFPDGGRKIFAYRHHPLPYRVRSSFHAAGAAPPQVVDEEYDGLGRKIRTVRYGEKGRPIESTWAYDVLGRVVRLQGPCFAGSLACRTEETDYDPWDRPTRTRRTHGEHGIAVTRYDYAGAATTVTDPDGSSRTTIRDHLNRTVRLIEHGDWGDLTTAFDYDAAGDLVRIVHPAGVETRFVRDGLGNIRAMSDPDMGTWEYAYDENGNLVSQTDARGRVLELDYDALNRLTAMRSLASGETFRYDYDDPGVPNGIGRLAAVTASQVATRFEAYDEMGRLLTETRVFSGDERRYTTSRQYDAAGNLIALEYPVGSLRIRYAYHPGTDLLHRVLDEAGSEIAAFEDYNADGNAGYAYFGNGTETIRAYDPHTGMIREIRVRPPAGQGGGDLLHREYGYTPAGDIAAVRNPISGITRRYTYDRQHRLVAEHPDPPLLVHPSKILRMRYAYTDSFPFHGPRDIEVEGRRASLEYDENGNITRAPAFYGTAISVERQLFYDDRNRTARIHQPGVSCGSKIDSSLCPDRLEFLYDGLNRRAVKRTPSSVVKYVGPHFEIRDGEPVCHVFAQNLRIAEITAKGIRYLHKDHLSSTAAVSDENGALVQAFDYSPFGLLRSENTSHPRYGYTDQEIDFVPGLFNFKARLYDAHLALFLSPDPYRSPDFAASFFFNLEKRFFPRDTASLIFIFEQPLSNAGLDLNNLKEIGLNRFCYAHQNPINLKDNDGLWPERIHKIIIKEYFDRKVDNSFIRIIISGSNFADLPMFQTSAFNHMHAMREPGETIDQARDKMQQYINHKLEIYYLNIYEGNFEKAYFILGMALHPIMDSTSPSHEGFQIWDSSKGFINQNALFHWAKEQFISSEKLQKTLELLDKALNTEQ